MIPRIVTGRKNVRCAPLENAFRINSMKEKACHWSSSQYIFCRRRDCRQNFCQLILLTVDLFHVVDLGNVFGKGGLGDQECTGGKTCGSNHLASAHFGLQLGRGRLGLSTWHNGKGVADANAEDGRKDVGKLHCDELIGFIVRNCDGYYVDGRPKDSLVFIGQSGLIVADDGSMSEKQR